MIILLVPLGPARLRAGDEQTFNSPAAALSALKAAVAQRDTNAIHAIFGAEARELVSPDVVQATEEFETFVQRVGEQARFTTNGDTSLTLEIGADAWTFPIPLVTENGHWFFDTAAGKTEILDRRIGRNELGAVAVCRSYVDAQREFADLTHTGTEPPAYAQLIRSSPNAHDGLFWPAKPGEDPSPFGPLIAAARVEGYHHTARLLDDKEAPYHGYYFKILTRQGAHAAGGRRDYLHHGRMTGGFALIAWPAEWGNTGVMTFIVSQEGRVFQANLGQRTPKRAAAITRFDPDSRWTPVP
jgi:hypothetical protein